MTLDGSKMNVSVVDKTNPVTADNLLDTEIEITNQQTGDTTTHKLREFATVEQGVASPTMIHVNSTRAITVTADVEDGYNNALLARDPGRPSSKDDRAARGLHHSNQWRAGKHQHDAFSNDAASDFGLCADLPCYGGAVPELAFSLHRDLDCPPLPLPAVCSVWWQPANS